MTENQNRYFPLIYGAGFVLGILFSLLYAGNQIVTGDQTQMLYKGYLGAYSDIWMSYGNAASAVGNVPGSLSAWLVGWPLMLWDSPWSPMMFLVMLRVVSFLLLDAVIKNVFGQSMRLAFLVIYWLNPWFLYDSLIYNPSYLALFAAMHLWSAYKMRDNCSVLYTIIHLLSIGMAMQLHYSWPLLVIISSYLFYRKMIMVSWFGFIVGGVVILASLIPYFLELQVNQSIAAQESDRYIGWGGVHVYPVLKSILYWVRYGSFLFPTRAVMGAEFDWVTNIEWLRMSVQYLWRGVLFIAGLATVILSAKINWRVWKAIRSKITLNDQDVTDSDWLALYSFSALLAIFISAILSPITFSYWHLIMTFPFSLLPVLYIADKLNLHETGLFAKRLGLMALFFTMVNLVAANDSGKYSYTVSYEQQVYQYIEENHDDIYLHQ